MTGCAVLLIAGVSVQALLTIFGGTPPVVDQPSAVPFRAAPETRGLSEATQSVAGTDGVRPVYRTGTRSITACDPATSECGIAVVSFPTGTPAVVPVGEPGVIVANQATPSYPIARKIVNAVLAGTHPTTALENALLDDPNPEIRAFGVAALWPDSPSGVAVAAFMGASAPQERCTVIGDTYTVQADIQTSSAVCQAMADGFDAAQGSLARRLLAALKAGTAAGTDFRGEYSAAIRVYQNTSIVGQRGWTFIGPDASVDRALDWQGELEFNLNAFIATLHEGFATDLVPLTTGMGRDILSVLRDLGYYHGSIDRAWNGAAEQALLNFGDSNSFFECGTVVSGGQRLIDAALAAYIVEGNRRSVLRPAG